MYHEDISKNYTSLTYPEFSQISDSAQEQNPISNSDAKAFETKNPSNNPNNYNKLQASADHSTFTNQYNSMGYSQNSQSFNNQSQAYQQQNYNYNNYNQDVYSQYQNQPSIPNTHSNYRNNQFSQNELNPGQFNQYQGQYNEQNYYSENQNYGGNNYSGNYNNSYEPFNDRRLPPINYNKLNFSDQPIDNYHSDNQGSRYPGYINKDERRRSIDQRGLKDDIDERRENDRYGDRKRKLSESEEESDTSYDSDTGATKTIYINNVYQKWTEKDIENCIKKHGIVVKAVRIIPRKKSGSGRSFAFADFYKVSEAEKWMDVTQSRLLFPDDTIAYLEYSEQCRNKAMTKRRDRGDETRERDAPKRGREGDWSCSKCDFWNFKWRDNCFRCSNVKSETNSHSDDDDDDDNNYNRGSRKSRRRSSEEDDRPTRKDHSNERENTSLAFHQIQHNVSYPLESVEVKYDYSKNNQISDSPQNSSNTSPPIIQTSKPKQKKTFQEGELWETLTEKDMEPPGGFKAPLPPIIAKKKQETGSSREKMIIEVKLKTESEKVEEQPVAELVASYGDSSSDEEDDEQLIDLTKLVCLLCKRAFMNQQTLRKHQTQSQLHKDNLAKYKQKITGSAIINSNSLKVSIK